MAKNGNLHAAKTAKNDEFYTRYEDINAEINTLEHGYRPHFENKIVYCNCDDPEYSNFWKFFKDRFGAFKIKRLISTHYEPNGASSYKLEYDGVKVRKIEMESNGDFRDTECIEILKEADIVVTNPPWSLFREYVAQLEEYGKYYIILGNKNAITYKEFFPLLKDNKLWLGYGGANNFMTPNGGTKKVNGLSRWFTNLDIPKRHEPLRLSARYYGYEKDYPKYDNYNAINVDKVQEIPCDYEPCWYKCPRAASCHYAQTEGKENKALCEQACNGEMGVPITFMDKQSVEQFALIGHEHDIQGNGGDGIPEGAFELVVGAQRERERERETTSLQANRYPQASVSVTELSECRSHSSTSYALNNSSSSTCAHLMEKKFDTLKMKPESLPENGATREFLSKKCSGIIGVPITFLDKYCSEQFEIIGMGCGWNGGSELLLQKYPSRQIQHTWNKKQCTFRDVIVGKMNDGTPLIKLAAPLNDATYYEVNKKYYIRTYGRIFIRRMRTI